MQKPAAHFSTPLKKRPSSQSTSVLQFCAEAVLENTTTKAAVAQ